MSKNDEISSGNKLIMIALVVVAVTTLTNGC